MPIRSAHIQSGLVARAALVLALASSSCAALAELPGENSPDWELRKDTGSIQVYTIRQPDSDFKAFKAVALMDTPIENLMAVMINPKSCVEWVHNCSESYAFGDGTFHDRYAYSVNDMPWPVADRDYVLRIRTHGDQGSGEVVMDLNAVPDRREPEEKYVRVDRSDTLYRFIPEGGKTRMIWVQHTDPNGALPGWLVNSLLIDIPVRSMEQLERVARTSVRYQNHRLVYDASGQLVAVTAAAKSEDDAQGSTR